MVDAAVSTGADCVKFQMRNMDVVYRKRSLEKTSEDLGSEYILDLLNRFELSLENHKSIADYCRSKEHEESEEQLLRVCPDLPACQPVPSSVGCKALPHAIIQRLVVGSVPRRRTCIKEGKKTEWDIRHGPPAPPKISPSFVSGATRALLFPPRPDSRIHGFRPVSPQSC